ncbi:flavodoxin family protein [Rhodopseudomonas boonkerdii]|uniref:flavodoxin family protein n=1 Tax=Rhodopseudomonas boonkerdii TaxID=475937 RepID=UPI001E6150B8|nr:flavodoxin family protein [Rhodopseudomonas boonkerdii]UGV27673.1 flavodoxin family protein [Rhodopseudomonas boonkerdii]
MTKIAIVYFSGYGHTAKLADSVQRGIASVAGVEAVMCRIDANGELDEDALKVFASADGIVFGSPTHAGGPAWQFKKFSDAFATHRADRKKVRTVSAGFTTSTSAKGDGLATLTYLFLLSQQHAYIWIGTVGESAFGGGWAAGGVGVSAICLPDEAFNATDLDAAASLGKRVANIVLKLAG